MMIRLSKSRTPCPVAAAAAALKSTAATLQTTAAETARHLTVNGTQLRNALQKPVRPHDRH